MSGRCEEGTGKGQPVDGDDIMDDMMKVLRAHLGRDPIGVLALRLHKEPEEILELLTRSPAQLLDLSEDGEVVEAILAGMLARARPT
ncbi:MAG TPA: hypothetical protein VF916_11960 [Ktedonobacterales bacterium]